MCFKSTPYNLNYLTTLYLYYQPESEDVLTIVDEMDLNYTVHAGTDL